MLKTDPVEQTPQYKAVEEEVHRKVEQELKDIIGTMGACFLMWKLKKEILKNDYGIEWKSPGELNPDIRFD